VPRAASDVVEVHIGESCILIAAVGVTIPKLARLSIDLPRVAALILIMNA